jgi:hypothetical protein
MRTVKSAIVACQVEQLAGQSTVRVELATKANGVLLGTIMWEPKWRQYAFTPAQGARFTVVVMRAISRQLDICMRAWERQHGKEKR